MRVPCFLPLVLVCAGGCARPASPTTEIEFFAGSRSISSAWIGSLQIDLASSSTGAYVVEAPQGVQTVRWTADGVPHVAEVRIGTGGSISALKRPPFLKTEGDIRIVRPPR